MIAHASPTPSFIRRRPRRRGWVVVGLICVAFLGKGFRPEVPVADPAHVASADYQVAAVNPDCTLKLLVPTDEASNILHPINVHWLGVEITKSNQAVGWLENAIGGSQQITVRLDRRRLDTNQNLQAYFYKGELLLNAELVRRGLAKGTTHPSDFAPIARQIREAQSLAARQMP